MKITIDEGFNQELSTNQWQFEYLWWSKPWKIFNNNAKENIDKYFKDEGKDKINKSPKDYCRRTIL